MKNFLNKFKEQKFLELERKHAVLSEKFTKCIMASPIPYIETDMEFRILDWNAAAEEVFGYAPRKALGQNMVELLFPENRRSSILHVVERVKAQPDAPDRPQATARNVRQDGRHTVCRWRVVPLFGNEKTVSRMVFRVMDLTQELNNRVHMQMTRKILSAMPDPVWFKDNAGVYQICNDKFAALVGRTRQEIIGQKADGIFDEMTAKEAERRDRILLQTKSAYVDHDAQVFFKGADIRDAIRMPILNADGTLAGILGIARNLVLDEVAIEDAVAQRKYRLVQKLEAAPVAYVSSDLEGIIRENNQYARDVLGFKTSTHVKRRFMNVDERELLVTELRASGKALNHTMDVYMASGEVRRFLVNAIASEDESGQPIYTYWALDIEDLKRAKDNLRQITDNLELILDSLPIPVALGTLEDMRVTYCNEAFIHGLSLNDSGDVLGKTLQELSAPEQMGDMRALEEGTRQLKDFSTAQRTVEFDWVFQRQDGEPVPTHVVAGRVFYKNQRSFAANIRDITQDIARQKLLEEAAATAAEANRLKSSFLANMSHEIRTPMNAIIGLSRIEIDRETNSQRATSFRKIHESAHLLLSIINDILDFSKIEAGKLALEEVEFNINQIIGEAMQVASPHLAGKRAEILYLPSSELPDMYVGDPTRLWQILKNILDNAARFTDTGEIVVSTHPLPANPDTPDIVNIEFKVRDTGIGMSEEQIQRVFAPFEQADGSTTRRYGGTGLGLSITRDLLKLMGGSISIESEPGVGSTFTFNLPLRKAQTTTEPVTFDDLNVLVVDDNPTARASLAGMLQAMGAHVQAVASGPEALALLQSTDTLKQHFNVLLLDFMMDGMNGIELAEAIGNTELSYSPRLLMVTAYARELLAGQLDNTHIMDVLEKPVNPGNLAEKLHQVLYGNTIAPKPVRPSYAKKKLLIAEDNAFNQDVAMAMLQPYEFDITMVANGKDAVEKATAEQYDLILMDIQMPEKDGLTATRDIRNSGVEWAKTVPILAMTAHAMKDDERKSLNAGMNGHLSKPIMPEILDEAIAKFLSPAQPEGAEAGAGAEAPHTLPFPAFRYIDMADGLSRFSGNTEVYTRLLLNFYRNSQSVLTELEVAASRLDFATFKRLVHTLKGTAGSIGAKNLMHTAATVEPTISQNCDTADYRLAQTRISAVLRPVLDELGDFAERYERDNRTHYDQSNPLDLPAFTEMLQQLLTLVEQSDMAALDYFHEITKLDGVGQYAPQLNEILNQLEGFDFSSVKSFIRALQKEIGATE